MMSLPVETNRKLNSTFIPMAGADPGFLVGEGANPAGEGANIKNCQIFPRNCMKLRKLWSVGGDTPLDPPLNSFNINTVRGFSALFFGIFVLLNYVNELELVTIDISSILISQWQI